MKVLVKCMKKKGMRSATVNVNVTVGDGREADMDKHVFS